MIADPSRSFGFTFITQAMSGAKIATKAIEIEAIAAGIPMRLALKRRQASSLGLLLTSPVFCSVAACIPPTLPTRRVLYKNAQVALRIG